MNQPTQQSTTPEQTATQTSGTGVSFENSFEARSAAVFGTDPSSQPAVEAETDPSSPETPAEATASPAGSEDVKAKERRDRLAKLEAEERERVDRRARDREHETLRQRLDAAEKKAAEAERRASGLLDPSSLTEERLIELAQSSNVNPLKLGEWIRDRMTNPEHVAAQAAKRMVDPEVAALRAELAASKKTIDDFMARQAKQAEDAAEQQAVHEFMTYTVQSAEQAPLSAAFLREYGAEEFNKVAISAAATVPAGSGAQAVLDKIEEQLSVLAKIYAAQQAAPQRPQATPPHPAAAKAPTTVSNTLAQTRASVVDEDAEWASLPFEERSARLFR